VNRWDRSRTALARLPSQEMFEGTRCRLDKDSGYNPRRKAYYRRAARTRGASWARSRSRMCAYLHIERLRGPRAGSEIRSD